jgi:hypothetical protein
MTTVRDGNSGARLRASRSVRDGPALIRGKGRTPLGRLRPPLTRTGASEGPSWAVAYATTDDGRRYETYHLMPVRTLATSGCERKQYRVHDGVIAGC